MDHADNNNIDNNELRPVSEYIKIAGKWWAAATAALFLLIFIFTRHFLWETFDYSQTGQIGDTFGGITAPFIGTAAAILTFLAFYMQLKANEMHSKQFLLEKTDKLREKHEERIFFLIAQNRSIVESMEINEKVNGARCFAQMYIEYRAIYEIAKSFYGGEYDEDFIANIAYLILFNGLGKASEQINDAVFKDIPKSSELMELVGNIKRESLTASCSGLKGLANKDEIEQLLLQLDYSPFQGHMTRLGHYFRNFFHILKYTTSVKAELMSDEEKYEIIKSLRSQLTSYEQIIVYANSISFYGAPMRNAGYIITFKLIKNIPLPQVEFAGDIRRRYKNIKFEWDEIVGRAQAEQQL